VKVNIVYCINRSSAIGIYSVYWFSGHW